VQWARANRGKVNYGSPGAGTTPHLSAALISKTRELGMTHIPYKGASQGVSALLANEVQFYMGGAGLVAQHVKAGKLHALAVSNAERLPALPDTPTFKEAGLADIKAANYWALAVPKATPPEVVQRLYREFRDALRSPAAQERFAKLGVVPVGTSPAETAQRWQEEAAYWGKAVKEMAIRID
jgi:tripartite-type tricarboxylate transporter receptor subunit TctC